ncbi:MAG: TAXI family TRAP transporter solute-binding subunit [Vicinamibacteraceae bacterium]
MRSVARVPRMARLTATLLVLLAVTAAACRGAAQKGLEQRTIRLTTGWPGGFFNPLGRALVSIYSKAMPDLAFQVVPSGGAINNLELLQRGEADLGVAFADVAYLAFVGRLDKRSIPFDHLRAVAVLQPTAVHVLVRPSLHITSIHHLRGRRVALGPSGSGTAATAVVLLEAFRLSPADVHGQHLPFMDAANQVSAGQLDAAFVSAGYPVESVQRATRAGADLLEVSGPVVERLRANYPFLRAVLIPSGTYPSLRRAVHTVGIHTVLACSADLDEMVVYRLTKTFFAALPELAVRVGALRRVDLARAPATPIPLHSGAARYYRERELFR